MATKTYIQKFYPGSFVAETSEKEVPNRNYPEKVERGCYGFRFYDRTEAIVDGDEVVGKAKNHSAMHYVGGKKLDVEAVKELPFNTRILESNMRCNNWEYVVETRIGNFQPWEENDVIIPCIEKDDGVYIVKEEENPFESD